MLLWLFSFWQNYHHHHHTGTRIQLKENNFPFPFCPLCMPSTHTHTHTVLGIMSLSEWCRLCRFLECEWKMRSAHVSRSSVCREKRRLAFVFTTARPTYGGNGRMKRSGLSWKTWSKYGSRPDPLQLSASLKPYCHVAWCCPWCWILSRPNLPPTVFQYLKAPCSTHFRSLFSCQIPVLRNCMNNYSSKSIDPQEKKSVFSPVFTACLLFSFLPRLITKPSTCRKWQKQGKPAPGWECCH